MSSLNFRLYKNESPVLQQWNMEGVKLYLLWHNFFRNFFIEKLKKYIKTVRAIPWKPFIYNIKQCLNLESNDLKLTVNRSQELHVIIMIAKMQCSSTVFSQACRLSKK